MTLKNCWMVVRKPLTSMAHSTRYVGGFAKVEFRVFWLDRRDAKGRKWVATIVSIVLVVAILRSFAYWWDDLMKALMTKAMITMSLSRGASLSNLVDCIVLGDLIKALDRRCRWCDRCDSCGHSTMGDDTTRRWGQASRWWSMTLRTSCSKQYVVLTNWLIKVSRVKRWWPVWLKLPFDEV